MTNEKTEEKVIEEAQPEIESDVEIYEGAGDTIAEVSIEDAGMDIEPTKQEAITITEDEIKSE